MKSDSRYLEMLQRIPLAEKGYRKRYSDLSEFWKQNRIKPWSCIPTTLMCWDYAGSAHYSTRVSMDIRTLSYQNGILSVLTKVYVARYRQTKVVPRINNNSVLGNRGGFFMLKNQSPQKNIFARNDKKWAKITF